MGVFFGLVLGFVFFWVEVVILVRRFIEKVRWEGLVWLFDYINWFLSVLGSFFGDFG